MTEDYEDQSCPFQRKDSIEEEMATLLVVEEEAEQREKEKGTALVFPLQARIDSRSQSG